MHRIHYAGDSVLTGSAIAQALLDYAEVLAKSATAATIEIPVREPDGSTGSSTLLVGPASQLIADVEPSHEHELVDDELVRRLERLTAELRRPRAVSSHFGHGTAHEYFDDL
ncbi:hypothetical protein ACFPER_04495 [Agromyces aurantiacus]|uniref:Uncharacterized protein n=1 Tax=Agromyces aurantiacus TaxID=165814 RepID=A0ABV9R373_9MICO|nr:hypothetical protein [Agromyces aurantiacus]MBM7502717.1 hypothetical protein [Agromyces aurantiacus]